VLKFKNKFGSLRVNNDQSPYITDVNTGVNYQGNGKGKDKSHPVTAHKGSEGEQMYSSTLS
jgi:hypothetical protein